MRVLVCGGRTFSCRACVFETLDALHQEKPITLVIEGGATGADQFARDWANTRGVQLMEMQADWDKYGKNAGPIRNKLMIDFGEPDLVVAFPGGRGTDNMKNLAKLKQVKVLEPRVL